MSNQCTCLSDDENCKCSACETEDELHRMTEIAHGLAEMKIYQVKLGGSFMHEKNLAEIALNRIKEIWPDYQPRPKP